MVFRAVQESFVEIQRKEPMRIQYRRVVFGIALTLAAGLASAQDLRVVHFKGLTNDYSPSSYRIVYQQPAVGARLGRDFDIYRWGTGKPFPRPSCWGVES